jgi:hypothetical protein
MKKLLLALPLSFALGAGFCGIPTDCPDCGRPPIVEPSLPPEPPPDAGSIPLPRR